MLVVNIKRSDNKIQEIVFNGHTEFDDYGKDIVCAAASSILITTVNACLKLDESSLSHEEKEDLVIVKVLNRNDIIDSLIENMYELLKDLEKKYEKNIKVD